MDINTSDSDSQDFSSLFSSRVNGADPSEVPRIASDIGSQDSSLVISGISVPSNPLDDDDPLVSFESFSDSSHDEPRNNRQVLADLLIEYADFCEIEGVQLDHELLRGKARNLYACGSGYIDFKCQQVACGHSMVLNQHCKLRVCQDCSYHKRSDWRGKYLPYLKKIDPAQLRFLTLTLKNRPELREGKDELVRHFKTLRLKKLPDRFKGGLVGYEAHEGEDGLYNIHCHVLYHGDYIDQAELSGIWKQITKDSDVVWISSVRGKGYKCKYRDKRISAQQSALDYILKYVVKGVGVSVKNADISAEFSPSWGADEWDNVEVGTDLSPFEVANEARSASDAKWSVRSLAEFMVFLHKSRLLQPFGSFIGESCKHSKEHLSCPECESEFFTLTLQHNKKEIFNALYMIHPDAPNLLSNGRIPLPGDRKVRRKKTVDDFSFADT